MFAGFANVWTPVTLARGLRRGKPLAVTLAGEGLVFFRDAGGKAAALIDRCPHRGVKLSLGRVGADGCLECPFHAWRFDGAGQARHVPLNPDAKKDRLSATALPTRELGGLLWVFTGNATDTEPNVPEGLTRADAQRTFLETEWNAHWTRAMENMLDSPHVPFLHRKTIGKSVRPYLKPDSSMVIDWEDTEYGGRTRAWLENATEDRKDRELASLDFYRPNIMVLNIPIPGKMFRIHALCIPVAEQKVRMIVIGARTFATFPLLNPIFALLNRRIVSEDQATVESSFPVEVPPASGEISVRTDRATLQFRKYYYEQLRARP